MTAMVSSINGVRLVEDIVFANAASTELSLDLVLPERIDAPLPVAIYLHGGGWSFGSRRMDLERRIAGVVRLGIAVANVDYRLGQAGRFPAAVHDVRGAVRWVRAHGHDYGLTTERVGAWGSSAGAHLALVAALGRDLSLEGVVGGRNEHSSTIDAVVNFFGLSDLAAKTARSPLEGRVLPPGPEHGFLGLDEIDATDTGEALRRARAASPLMLVHAAAPPVLSVHGDRDQMVPVNQSQRLHEALVAAGGRSTLVCIGGAGHEDPAFDQPFVASLVAQFLCDMLLP